jgi:O-antigen/teichoic acid export membrane protein
MDSTSRTKEKQPEIEDRPAKKVPSPPRAIKSQLLGGVLTLLAGSGFVGITNLAYNVLTARLLGPTGFANATAVYTILMLLSSITLAFQVVCAKYIAKNSSEQMRHEVFACLHQRAWIAALAIGLLLFFFKDPLTAYLNLPDPALISLLALGAAFYIPLGVRRGYIQGIHAFGPLAMNFILEGLVRLGGVYLLIEWGLGVRGAVLASVLAVMVAYFVALPSPGFAALRFRGFSISSGEGLQAIVFFAGQTVINNFDIVLVKHFFPPVEAGFYAAIALVGRLVNMCAWSVVNTMFPVSAGAGGDEHEASPVLFTSLAMVFLILSALIFSLWLIPNLLWKTLFGAQFATGSGLLAPLLILYAITSGIYSLSSVIITYEMSRRIANTSWLQLAFSGALALGVYLLHRTLREVIWVQLVLMILLLIVLVVPLVRNQLTPKVLETFTSLNVRQQLSEEEVMAEFLKSEFHHPEFDDYRQEFEALVKNPDLGSPRENAVRQALLFLRRGTMWRELPSDTKWFEIVVTARELDRIRFFPRAQWRRVAEGSFYLNDVIGHLRARLENSAEDRFVSNLRFLGASIGTDIVNPTVLLIGIDREGPLTILDGNHRIASALLAQPLAALSYFRFICGFSPMMIRCCWYHTNVNTLLRYLKNVVRYLSYDAETDIVRLQEEEY